MKILKILAISVLVVVAIVFWKVQPLLKVGAGYAAKMACSCHYLQGRELDDIKAGDLNFSAMPYFSVHLNEAQKQADASFFGLISAKAQYVQGHGCINIVDEKQTLAKPIALPQPSAALTPFDTLPAGVNLAKIQAAVDTAMHNANGGQTRATLVLYKGKLLYESYADGFDQNTPLLGWSMTKTITNALVGIMVKNGDLSLEQDQLFEEWKADDRAKLQLTNLLRMNSGLDWNEEYGGVSDATRMLYMHADMGAFASAVPLAKTPDTYWYYSSGTSNILSRLLRQTLANDDAYYALLQDSLFAKLGMNSAVVELDQSGNYVGSSYAWATAQDWARFGQLYLQDGIWNGERILPAGWVDYSVASANGSDGEYGAQIWLQTPDMPDAPKDKYAFQGYQGQRVMVIPSKDCVIVRLGVNNTGKFDFNRLCKDVLAALPAAH